MVHLNVTNEFFKAASFTGVLVTNDKGEIIYVDENFEEKYQLNAASLLGQTVYELERKRSINPSAAAIVLKTKKEVTLIQTLKNKQKVIVSAFPIFDDAGRVSHAVTFARDIEQHIHIKELYEKLAEKIAQYDAVISRAQYDTELLNNYVTDNEAFARSLKSICSAAKYNVNMLILGDTGVGKTLLARKIHDISSQSEGLFVEVNCGALPGTLVESELFGYEKGAFTGASEQGKKGLFEIADKGTLFLDEITEMPLQSQTKLLQVLQDGQFRRIGGSQNIKTDCRIISATNKDLKQEVESGTFRRDLYYRLNTVNFTVPPLKERKEDIILLCNQLLGKANLKFKQKKILDKSVVNAFLKYDWPGNVRELENVIYGMVVTTEDAIITSSSIPEEIARCIGSSISRENTIFTELTRPVSDLKKAMEIYEGEIIKATYLENNTSFKLAQALNISQATAARKIRKYVR